MNSKILGIDWFLIIPVGLLIIISLVTLFSVNPDFFRSQLIFLVVSILAFIFFSQTNYKILDTYSKPIYIASLILLVLVFFLGIESRGSTRWIEFLGLRAQFSEVLKPFLAISFASYLVNLRNYGFRSLLSVFVLLVPIALLIFLQPDLGNALLYSGVVLVTAIYFGFSFKYFAGMFLPLLAVFPLVWKLLHEYQRQRILTFLDPGKDPLGHFLQCYSVGYRGRFGNVNGKRLGAGNTIRFKVFARTSY